MGVTVYGFLAIRAPADKLSLQAFIELKAAPHPTAVLCCNITVPGMLETYCRTEPQACQASWPASPGDKHLLFGEPGIQWRMLCSIDRLNAAGRGKEKKPKVLYKEVLQIISA